MLVNESPDEVRQIVREQRQSGKRVGVVPTMGALHLGHISLVETARNECDFVVGTIFVNPTQFGPNEDFDRYPRTLEQDLQKCEAAGADLVFTPDVGSMYSDAAATIVQVAGLTDTLEGEIRPGHFDGVTTIVAKLFNITDPDRAYFGQKDYQQQLIIRRMTADLDWGIDIVTCPIVREEDGLAMSSRNRYLSDSERERSLVLFRSLQLATRLADEGELNTEQIQRQMQQVIKNTDGVELDYAVVVDTETLQPPTYRLKTAVALVAARLGKTRLIDNQILRFG